MTTNADMVFADVKLEIIATIEHTEKLAVHLPTFHKKITKPFNKAEQTVHSESDIKFEGKEERSEDRESALRNELRYLQRLKDILNNAIERSTALANLLEGHETEIKTELKKLYDDLNAVNGYITLYNQAGENFNAVAHVDGSLLKTLLSFKNNLANFKTNFTAEEKAVYTSIRALVVIENRKMIKVTKPLEEHIQRIDNTNLNELKLKLQNALNTIKGWERVLYDEELPDRQYAWGIEKEIDEILTLLSSVLGSIDNNRKAGHPANVNKVAVERIDNLKQLYDKLHSLINDETSFYKLLMKMHETDASFFDAIKETKSVVDEAKTQVDLLIRQHQGTVS